MNPIMLYLRLKIALFTAFELALKKQSLVGDHRFFDSTQFPWVRHIEDNHGRVRGELDRLLKFMDAIPNFQDISIEQNAITNDGLWKTFFFYAYGRKMQTNCEICPETAALLESIPGMTTAFFSILLPNKSIPIHRGPFAGVLRYHLGLRIPTQATSCGIEVGGETASWEEGRSLVFDDTYPHRAWNLSDELRVVLFVDFQRPLSFPFSLLNRAWISIISASPFIKGLLYRQKHWDVVLQDSYVKNDM
jgi:aspartyl/asparaginyl beta-hydroxylase (cupin superfamily)